jgi:hypothetical protein
MRNFANREPSQLPFFMKRREERMSLGSVEKRQASHLAWTIDIVLMHGEAAPQL